MTMIGFKETFWINLALLTVVALASVLANPIALLGLLALRDLPVQVLDMRDEEEELSNPMGFIHSDD